MCLYDLFLNHFGLPFHVDDHLGGITNCSGNVMYKAAGRSFLTNGGAGARKINCCAVVLRQEHHRCSSYKRVATGNNITHNLIVNGGVGIYNHGDTGEITCNNGTSNVSSSGASMSFRQDLKLAPDYSSASCNPRRCLSVVAALIPGTHCLYRASGGGGRDFVAGTEAALGVHSYEALFSTPLAKRWPSFGRLMSINSTKAGWASAADSNFQDNVFLNNSRNICLLTNYHGTAQHPGEACDEQLPEPGLPQFM